jgi:hypothetical protein
MVSSFNDLKGLVESQLKMASIEFGIDMSIEKIYIFGDNLSQIEEDFELNIFVELADLTADYQDDFIYDDNDDRLNYGQQQTRFLARRIGDYVNGNYSCLNSAQTYHGKIINFMVSDRPFNLHIPKMLLNTYSRIIESAETEQDDVVLAA